MFHLDVGIEEMYLVVNIDTRLGSMIKTDLTCVFGQKQLSMMRMRRWRMKKRTTMYRRHLLDVVSWFSAWYFEEDSACPHNEDHDYGPLTCLPSGFDEWTCSRINPTFCICAHCQRSWECWSRIQDTPSTNTLHFLLFVELPSFS